MGKEQNFDNAETQALNIPIVNDSILIEKRKCGECKCFQSTNSPWEIGSCEKRNLIVTKTMNISYKEVTGTCFE